MKNFRIAFCASMLALLGCSEQLPKTSGPRSAPDSTVIQETNEAKSQSAAMNGQSDEQFKDGSRDDKQLAVETQSDSQTTKQAPPIPKKVVSVKSPNSDDSAGNGSAVDPTKLTPLDLTAEYHAPAANFDGYGRGTWKNAPRNSVTLGNIPLMIGGVINLWGAGNAGRGMVFPKELKAIPVNRKFEAIYIYQCTFHSSPDSTPVASLIFNYDDGKSEAIDILYGDHVRDWWKKAHEPDEILDRKSKKIVRGLFPDAAPGQPAEIQFFLTELANPEPSKTVVSIDMVSAEGESAACIMAMTTGPKEMVKGELVSFEDPVTEQKRDGT